MNYTILLDEDKMSLTVDKLSMYSNEESASFGNIKSDIRYVNEQYKTNNSSALDSKLVELSNKMKVIESIHSNNIYVLRTKIQQHLALKYSNISNFNTDNIDTLESRNLK